MIHVTRVNFRTDLYEKPGSRLVAVGSVELDKEFKIEYVRILRPHDGRFLVAMPSRFNEVTGEHKDLCHPITERLRKEINEAVLDALRKR